MTEFIIAFISGLAVGIAVVIAYVAYRYQAIISQIGHYVDRAIDETLLGITVEKHEGVYRFYRASDNQFIHQTTDLTNIRAVFKEQFPTKTCYIEGGDEEAVAEIKRVLVKG